MISLDDELQAARAAPLTTDEMRQRLRAAIIELVPNKWGLQGTLFRAIDHSPAAAVLAKFETVGELFGR